MKIACEACGAKYTIADDKVRGRKVKIRCKSCGTSIVVDGQHGRGGSISDVETDAALEPENGAVSWSVNLSDTDSRTMSVDEIVAAYASGVVTADAFVWKDGMADWVPILESEIAPLLRAAEAAPPEVAAPVLPVVATPAVVSPTAALRGTVPQFSASAPNQATAAARPAATRAQWQPDNTADLFGAIDVAGGEEEVATSAPIIPQAGTSAYGDGNMTGARNENSVLFSLDALKAGFSPSAPAAQGPKASSGGGRAPQTANADDPFGMGASAGLMGGGALFGTDNQALLTAPAAEPRPPAQAGLSAGFVPVAPARGNKKLVLLFGIGGVVIIGLLLALLLSKHEDTAPGAQASASASANAASLPVAAEEKQPDGPAPKTDKAASASAAVSASAEPAVSASAEPAVSASAEPEKKAANKAVASSAGATTKPSTDSAKKKEEPTPAGASDLPPFSKSSAISGLTAASMAASACKKPGGPTGSGKATVTFAPSGRVTTATVGGAYAGTAVGGCVASGFRKAHVPAFSGAAVTVSKSFTIN